MAIISGLQSSGIYRLRDTWDVSKEIIILSYQVINTYSSNLVVTI